MIADQLLLDLTPVGAVSVGDRVQVLAASSDWAGLEHLVGRQGVVTKIRPPCIPGHGATWLPVLVLLDGDEPGREYAFEHEDLDVLEAVAL